MERSIFSCLVLVLGIAATRSSHAGLVDLSLNPESSKSSVGELVLIKLSAIAQNDPGAAIAAVDAILDWDPVYLELVGVDDTNDAYPWLVSGFLLDPDGINDDRFDGDAIYTALSQTATPAAIPDSPGWVLTTVVFRALAPTNTTSVSLVGALGKFGKTRVIDFSNPGVDLIGNHNFTAKVTISENRVPGPSLDVHPGSCPNPINVRSRGSTPVALVGSSNFDVSLVDTTSLWLERRDEAGGAVVPKRTRRDDGARIADVATPVNADDCDCHKLLGDGIEDLQMFFATKSTASALELDQEENRTNIEVVLRGSLYDGTPFEVSDCVTVVGAGKGAWKQSRKTGR